MTAARTLPAARQAASARPEHVEQARVDPPIAVYVPLAGFLALLTLAAILGDARGGVPDAASLALFALALASCSTIATSMTALLLAGCAWLDYDGFVIGRQGSLTWHGTADVTRILVLAGSTLLVLTLRRAWWRRQVAARPAPVTRIEGRPPWR